MWGAVWVREGGPWGGPVPAGGRAEAATRRGRGQRPTAAGMATAPEPGPTANDGRDGDHGGAGGDGGRRRQAAQAVNTTGHAATAAPQAPARAAAGAATAPEPGPTADDGRPHGP
ncbi:hypothetical protein GCM10010383_50260 [Streptomyces lomondensis]|uniref:Uncharacterized protein n=2 Tax=Streptomyces lomondensis TaxID=68229 RepID=A0ABQ2XFL0_9ACTN|nr:hypothetical protein GCM10010383_50260 [Streptomyces lomondensis]